MNNTPSKALTVYTPPPILPYCVLWFEALFYVSTSVSAIGILLQWAKGMPGSTAIFLSLLLAFQISLIWLAARRRKNWARKLLLAFFLIWSIGSILSTGLSSQSPDWQPPDISIQAVKLTKIFLETIALILAFSGNSRRWFYPRISGHRDPKSPW